MHHWHLTQKTMNSLDALVLDNFSHTNPALPTVVARLIFEKNMSTHTLSNPDFVGFRWTISTNRGDANVIVCIPKRLNKIPIIFLENYKAYQPLPHILFDGYVCYIDTSAFVFNQFDPIRQTFFCLDKAQEVIKAIFDGKFTTALEDEFYAYWNHKWNRLQMDFCGYVDIDKSVPKNKLFCFKSKSCFYFSNAEQNLRKKIPNKLIQMAEAFLLITPKQLKASKPWPPSKGYEFCQWIGQYGVSIKKKFIARAKPKNNELYKFFVLSSPHGYYAFCVRYPEAHNDGTTLEKLFQADIFLMTTSRIDDQYVVSRNNPSLKNLENKTIALVGCGSIGGFLASFLVKLGAGTGTGQLVLIDNDTFEANNIGRHFLGWNSLGQTKVKALKSELYRLMPTNNISYLEKDATKLSFFDLEKFDLVIDATGEEAIGNHLCSLLRSKPLLSLWIEGNGWAVRGLLRTKSTQACYHCIRQYELEDKLLAVQNPQKLVLHGGCRSQYVTYPISVAVQAACLGTDMAIDWANNIVNPTLRTRLTDSSKILNTSDFTPEPHPNCPLCNPVNEKQNT